MLPIYFLIHVRMKFSKPYNECFFSYLGYILKETFWLEKGTTIFNLPWDRDNNIGFKKKSLMQKGGKELVGLLQL